MAIPFVALAGGSSLAAPGPPPDACQGQWTVPSPLRFEQPPRYYITLYLKGLLTRALTGYMDGTILRHAGLWTK